MPFRQIFCSTIETKVLNSEDDCYLVRNLMLELSHLTLTVAEVVPHLGLLFRGPIGPC